MKYWKNIWNKYSSWKKRYRYPINTLVLSIVAFFLLNLLFPLRIDIDYSQIVLSDEGEVLNAYLTEDDKWRMYTSLEEISPTLRKAIIQKEDKYFYYHFGVNPIAITRALFNNITKQRRTSGASTITMQVARMLEPKRRTYVNKVIEIFRAIQLEIKYSKDEILQLYLNLVPYGGNIEGVKSASVLYFQKSPNHLSLAEVTTLSVIPNRPSSLVIGRNNGEIIQFRNKWLSNFKEEGAFTVEEIEDALSEPLNSFRNPAPNITPHLANRLRFQYPDQDVIKTNVDLDIQNQVDQIVKNYIKRTYFQNIKNASVLVVDNQTMKVISYVGSADFHNNEDAGQVDGIRAVRQPGSTLKPLLYAQAIDKGLITPKYMMTDAPVDFGGYRPENFDEKYNGYVSAEFALSTSLNIPAVKLLKDLEVETFVDLLKAADFEQITKDEEKLGLSVALGGCGVTLEELTQQYAMFANSGLFEELQFLDKIEEEVDSTRLISSASAFMITEILLQLKRPDLPISWRSASNIPHIAWKTGTSYGRKDAWSIGYNNRYTIGVWVGNFSGEGVPELTGADKATPLLFKLFNAIDDHKEVDWNTAPADTDFRLVCGSSGLPPNEFCNQKIVDHFIPLVSPSAKCQHMQQVFVAKSDSFSYCTSCLPVGGYYTNLYPNHPSEILSFYDISGIPYTKVPEHNPNCERIFTANAPKIVSPTHHLEYFIDPDEEENLMLSCQLHNDANKAFWYVNDQYVGEAEVNENLFVDAPEGRIKISCTDDKGRNTDIVVHVKYVDL